MFTDTPYRVRVVGAFVLAALVSACRGAGNPADSTTRHAVQTQPAEVPPAKYLGLSLYQLPGSWRNHRGDSVRLSSLAGRVRIVAMVYTNCHASCPAIISDMKRIEASLSPSERDAVGFVLVSLDPAHDTPARLTEWANSIGLDLAHWTLLSGTEQRVRALSAALDVRYQSQQNGELAHTNGLTVLDDNGTVAHQQVGLGETLSSIRIVKSLVQ